ncbi:hotdog fold thioesterase [Catellatospora coxensis]
MTYDTTMQGALAERMGIKLLEATPERLVATMPVEGNTQPFGLLHGGASCVLAETLGSIGATLHGSTIGRPYAVGVDISATHHRAARSGLVTGVATRCTAAAASSPTRSSSPTRTTSASAPPA